MRNRRRCSLISPKQNQVISIYQVLNARRIFLLVSNHNIFLAIFNKSVSLIRYAFSLYNILPKLYAGIYNILPNLYNHKRYSFTALTPCITDCTTIYLLWHASACLPLKLFLLIRLSPCGSFKFQVE